jgi:hydrogenase maturation factor
VRESQGLPKYGKINASLFNRLIFPRLGSKNTSVLVGPSPGLDTCVIRVAPKRVLVASTDPISFIPDLGAEYSAWQSVNLIATDIATSGFSPRFALFDFNLPPKMKSVDFERYYRALSSECKKLGIAIVGGHTSRFEGLDSTVIGACTMFALGPESDYISSSHGMVGDKVMVTKGAAISSTAILARAFPKFLRAKIGERGFRKATRYLRKTSALKDALTAAEAGATAMHDAAEGGVLSALYELASASRTGLRIELEKIPVSDETSKICEIFRMDPYTSLSEGSLVLSCRPMKANRIISSLHSAGISASVVGELTREKFIAITKEGREVSIKYPVIDPYWRAYYGAKKRQVV